MINRFFIIGNPRSGTTLLRLMLNKHTNVSVPPEAGFLVWLYEKFLDFAYTESQIELFLFELEKTKKIEIWGMDYSDLLFFLKKEQPKNYSQLIDLIYVYYAKRVLHKDASVYGDKNNYYLNHIDLLGELYPEAKFIHIIRDGRSTAASYIELMNKNIKSKYAPKLPNSIEKIANEWMSNISTIESSFEKLKKENKVTIKFEDLIVNPHLTLTEICNFLKIPFQNAMLEYYQIEKQSALEPKEFLQWKQDNLKPLQVDKIKEYKALPSNDIETFEAIAAKSLKRYNYF